MDKETLVLVPFGKYAGIWRYLKRHKTTTWRPYTLQDLCERKVLPRKPRRDGKLIRFPLPEIVYMLHGSAHPGKLHSQNRKALGYATLAWKKLLGSKLKPFQDLVKQANSKIEGSTDVEQGAAMACSFAMPHFLRLVEIAPDLARDRALHLSRYSNLLKAMRPAQRQRFVIRLIQHGIKPAIQKTFTGTHTEVIDSILGNSVTPYMSAVIKSKWGTNNLADFYRTMSLANYFTWIPVRRVALEDWSE